jgi:hypothetical protein
MKRAARVRYHRVMRLATSLRRRIAAISVFLKKDWEFV